VKSLGAKTNHLPNIQGQTVKAPLLDGVGNKNFAFKCLPFKALKSEEKFIL
jgi:hypothetical protein